MQNKYMPAPQVCPDFSAQPIGFESSCTPFLIFFIAIILTFVLLILEIFNEKCFTASKSPTKQLNSSKEIQCQATSRIVEESQAKLMKVEESQRIIEKKQSVSKFLKHVMKEETRN